jgi:hypothetical protein
VGFVVDGDHGPMSCAALHLALGGGQPDAFLVHKKLSRWHNTKRDEAKSNGGR